MIGDHVNKFYFVFRFMKRLVVSDAIVLRF